MIKLKLTPKILNEDIQKLNSKIFNLAKDMEEYKSVGNDFLGWKDLPFNQDPQILHDIEQTSKKLKKMGVNTLVVVGIGGSYIASKAAIEMIQGKYSLNQDMEIIFFGESLSSSDLAQKLLYLEDKEFAINVISKSGTTLEPSIAFRLVRELLYKKIGKHNASEYIVATTDANKGALSLMSKEKGYKTFVIPDDVGGRFSVLTPVGLFPMSCAGINIKEIMIAAKQASEKYKSFDLNQNIAYQYAAARHILSKSKPVELMIQYEPQMTAFSEWWKQLAGESEGKSEKGVFPASAIFSTDLHSLGQFIQQGSKILFETMMFCKKPNFDLLIPFDQSDFEKLNKYREISIHRINSAIYNGTITAHHNIANVPIIEIEYQDFSESTFAHLVIFFERAIAMTAYLQEVNPFNQPGVEIYKHNMFKILDIINLKLKK